MIGLSLVHLCELLYTYYLLTYLPAARIGKRRFCWINNRKTNGRTENKQREAGIGLCEIARPLDRINSATYYCGLWLGFARWDGDAD